MTLALALVAAACGSGEDDTASTTTGAPTTTAAVATTTAPTTEAPATTVTALTATTPPTTSPETTTSTTTAPAPAAALPDLTTIVDDVELGVGFVLATSPVAPVAWVLAPSDGAEVLGCEGVPAEPLWAQAVDGSTRTPALPDDPELVGIGEVAAHPDGRVLLVRACEGFLVDAWIGEAGPDGVIGEVTRLDLPDTTLFSTIRLTQSGVTYVDRDQFGTSDGALVELDLGSGTRSELVTGDIWDGAGLTTGSTLYRTGTELFVDGFSLGTFPEAGPFTFDFEPDRRGENVAVDTSTGLAAYLGAVDELTPLLDEEVAVLDWHPSGEAVLVNGPIIAGEPTPPRVVLLDGTTIPLPVTGEIVGGTFTSDGRTVILTSFVGGETIELQTEALTFAS